MLICRIVFVIIFQNAVAALNSLLKAAIPDVPKSLQTSKRKHMYLTNELIIRHELVVKAKHQCDLRSATASPTKHFNNA